MSGLKPDFALMSTMRFSSTVSTQTAPYIQATPSGGGHRQGSHTLPIGHKGSGHLIHGWDAASILPWLHEPT